MQADVHQHEETKLTINPPCLLYSLQQIFTNPQIRVTLFLQPTKLHFYSHSLYKERNFYVNANSTLQFNMSEAEEKKMKIKVLFSFNRHSSSTK